MFQKDPREFNAEEESNKLFLAKPVPKVLEERENLEITMKKTAEELKDNVFKHHQEFIHSSKEIGNLEQDLLELRNILNEQSSVVKGLLEFKVNIDESFVEKKVDPLSQLPDSLRTSFNQLYEISDKLDIAISQHQYDDAVTLTETAKMYLRDLSVYTQVKFYGASLFSKIESQIDQLTVILLADLQNATFNFSESKKIIGYLLKLGLSQKAREMYLSTRSSKIEREIKCLKLKGDLSLYINHVSAVVFSSINYTWEDFRSCFKDKKEMSSFVVWAINELKKLAEIIKNHIFQNSDDSQTREKCLKILYDHCEMLEEKGLNFSFALKEMFQNYHHNIFN